MTPLTLIPPDTEEVMMGREPDKLLGVVSVFEAEELVCVYFVILLCMGSPSSSKSLSLSNSLALPLEMTSPRPFKV